MDRNKVIKGLEGLCEHLFHVYKVCYKGDEEDNYNWFLAADNALALLKEQEAVTPKVSMSGLWYECPACRRHLTKDIDHYCARCGKAVKWE